MTDRSERFTLPLMGLALVALPFCLSALGLTLTSATDVVVFAVACLGLNILVGQTGLVSFGHGAFFGIGAYAAAIGQRTFFPGTLLPPILFALAFVALAAMLLGLLILHQVPGPLGVFGIAFVVAAGVAAARTGARAKPIPLEVG